MDCLGIHFPIAPLVINILNVNDLYAHPKGAVVIGKGLQAGNKIGM